MLTTACQMAVCKPDFLCTLNLESTEWNQEPKTQVSGCLTLGKRISATMQATVPEFTVGYLTQVPRFLCSFLRIPSFTRLPNVAETQVGLW